MLVIVVLVLGVLLMAVLAVLVDRFKRQRGVPSWYHPERSQYGQDEAATQSRLNDDIPLH